MSKYGKAVRRKREKHGLSQVALAEMAGVASGSTMISRIENGASCNAETRAKLDRVLDEQSLNLHGADPIHAKMAEGQREREAETV